MIVSHHVDAGIAIKTSVSVDSALKHREISPAPSPSLLIEPWAACPEYLQQQWVVLSCVNHEISAETFWKASLMGTIPHLCLLLR